MTQKGDGTYPPPLNARCDFDFCNNFRFSNNWPILSGAPHSGHGGQAISGPDLTPKAASEEAPPALAVASRWFPERWSEKANRVG